MFRLDPLPRRIVYVVVFEALAILLASVLLAAISGGSTYDNLPVAIAASAAAMIWYFGDNTAFEAWERRTGRTARPVGVRVVHALGFEGGLVVILIPLFMWWYSVSALTALAMEAALLVFFLAFTFVFTWVFDLTFERPSATRA